MTGAVPVGRLRPVGSDAVLVDLDDPDAVVRLAARLAADLRDGVLPGVAELVPAASTLLVRLHPGRAGERARRLLAERCATSAVTGPPAPGEAAPAHDIDVVDVPVVYDGEDLAEVSRLTGLDTAEVVRRHTASAWTVAFTGFAPGFGYLVGGDPALRVPRRASPRTAVPAGAVGLAGAFSGVYPRASPGGWQLLGRTDLVLWDAEHDPPALLRPGVRVRFRAVAALPAPDRDHGLPTPRVRTGRAASPEAAAFEVLDPGVSTTVQDLGRPGRADLGVSASGALDRSSLRRANRAVGNAPGAPALESAGGLVVAARGRLVVAVAGATAPVLVERASGAREPAAAGLPVALDDGDVLTLGAPTAGSAAHLAVRGGLDVVAVLGSAARDVLAGLGPEPLRTGDGLAVGHGWLAGSVAVVAEAAPQLPRAGEVVVLDVVVGPRDDWFDPASLHLLGEQDWVVTPRSNRVGARLQGAAPLLRGRAGGSPGDARELPSEGAVRGALQVPPDGQPVLFGPDHPVTGGYPVIACVAAHHLDLSGQLPVGARVRFRAVEPAPLR